MLIHCLQVLNCVSGLLKGDDDVEVRKSAAMFITLLLQGLGDDALKVMFASLTMVAQTHNCQNHLDSW